MVLWSRVCRVVVGMIEVEATMAVRWSKYDTSVAAEPRPTKPSLGNRHYSKAALPHLLTFVNHLGLANQRKGDLASPMLLKL
jgi:hypothetical protein